MIVDRSIVAGLAGMGALAGATTTWARVQRAGRPARRLAGDAIVVFGAAVRATGPSPELQARLDHAAHLYERGSAPTILCSGGFSRGVCEASAMRAALVRRGIPPEAVIMDDQGRTTRRTVAAIRRHNGRWRAVIGVSSPYHMHRIQREARRQGVALVPSPATWTPIADSFGPRIRQHLREVAAVWWYALGSWTARLLRLG